MFTLLQQGGWVMGMLLAGGWIALAVFLERWFHLHRARIKSEDFLKGICNVLRRRNVPEALKICEETPGPVACLMRTAIQHRTESRDVIGRAIAAAALTEIGRLERRFNVLATVAQIAPLLGILGTVLGMIQAYLAIQQKAPLVQISDLSGGIWQALLTTAAGLGLAILSYAAYNLLVTKADTIILDMERATGEILGFFTGAAEESTGVPVPPA